MMAYSEVNDLIRFLGDSAHDLSVRAVMAAPVLAQTLSDEAEDPDRSFEQNADIPPI